MADLIEEARKIIRKNISYLYFNFTKKNLKKNKALIRLF